jgi:hypothetical protein
VKFAVTDWRTSIACLKVDTGEEIYQLDSLKHPSIGIPTATRALQHSIFITAVNNTVSTFSDTKLPKFSDLGLSPT